MPSSDILITFLTAAAIFAFIPGPGILYAAALTLAGGRRIGFLGTLGLALGGYLHVLAAAAGLSVVFHAVPPLYAAVKLIGAAYLIWLGVSMIRAKAVSVNDVVRVDGLIGVDGVDGGIGTSAMTRKTGKRALLEGITVEMLNPKTAMFFLAFLPQFTDPSASLPVWMQFMILGSIVNLMFAMADCVAVLLASSVVNRLGHSNRFQHTLQQVGGGIMVALGIRLALQKD
jgi:threonine/homoserine/homoserine lactone efflux protein